MLTPCTSALYSCSSTALSRSGRMIATTSFMIVLRKLTMRRSEGRRLRRLPIGQDQDRAFAGAVRLFAVLTDVHAGAFFVRRRLERHHEADEFEQDQRAHTAVDDRREDGERLDAEL